MNQKLGFLCFWGIRNSLASFWAKLGYSRIKIDNIADSLLKLQIKIGVHLINKCWTVATPYSDYDQDNFNTDTVKQEPTGNDTDHLDFNNDNQYWVVFSY